MCAAGSSGEGRGGLSTVWGRYGSITMMVPESPLESTEHGLVPKGKGWFVLNAREAPWIDRKGRGVYCEFEGFEGEPDF